MRRELLGLAAASLVAFAAADSRAEDPEKFTIGAILAMSGSGDWYGKVMSAGIELAVEEINAEGGIDGIPLEAVFEDHKSGIAREGVNAINRLINMHDVQAVFSSFSPPTIAIAPIADEQGILVVNGGGVSTAMVGISDNLFHNRSLASDLGRAAVAFADEEGWSRMAQIAWRTDAGESIISEVEPYWEELGGEVVATEWMDQGATNIDTQIAKMRTANPDFLALWLFSPDPGMAMRRAREFGIDVPVVGVEYTADVAEIGGDHMEGYYYTSDYFTPTDDWSQRFQEAYRERYGEDPEFYAANYYEGVYLIAEAIRRARAEGGDYYDGANLARIIREQPTYPSVYGGEMTFQDNGVAQKRVALFQIQDGESEFQRYLDLE
ncbi:ABC transporter substrate-binding protein [Aquibaculum arenosum]|uniref:ABC transporter substrate-binding protein n=1 Tax=Aquibaculum arenosum TaxID=3032591 RepID=A0ABT5YP10_9PROT|nr:ABC transporter substrate-binding protein [Fodinicurvata sp. CAU 1616]MDF2096622.1 ABC transporter substrate-binding protein [Fodinicurvata sp. CAU 1616]